MAAPAPNQNPFARVPVWVERDDGVMLRIREATLADVPTLEAWDLEPQVIAATTDDPNATQAFGEHDWRAELANQTPANVYFIAEIDSGAARRDRTSSTFLDEVAANMRPIGAMQVIDPLNEPTHYWGETEPNLRAIDIWLGADATGQGYGEMMMYAMINENFVDPAVTAIVIDPLASNTRAHRFYQRLSFKPVGRRTFGDDDCLVHRLERADWEAQ